MTVDDLKTALRDPECPYLVDGGDYLLGIIACTVAARYIETAAHASPARPGPSTVER